MKKLLLSLKVLIVACTLQVHSQAFIENFNDITTLPASGWSLQNVSVAVGSTNWFQGSNVAAGGPFDSFNGAANAYIGTNFNNTGSLGTISNWLVTPNRTLKNGDVLTFYTKKATPDTYPDRLEVRMSTNGASTAVGSGATVGDFTTLLLSINPTLTTGVYPTAWTQYTITISGLSAPTSGRLAFRYFVTSAGFSGTNSDYIGIDNVSYTPYVCPTIVISPAAAALPVANSGMPYSTTFTQTGVLGTPAFAFTSGVVPAGLSLSSSGVLSGTPTGTGSFSFTVTVSDASGCSGSNDYTLELVPCELNLTPLSDIEAQCSVALADITVPTITDSCGNTITPTTDAVFPITAQGTTTITWLYADILGNFETLTQDVTLFDFTEPTPDVAILADINAECEVLEADVTLPTATDNCLGAVTVTNDATFPITAQGTTTITWTYTDVNGNFSTQTQDVTLFDFTDPVPDAAILADINAECEVLEADVTPPTATDNCSGTVTVTNDATFPITAQGTTTITWTYTDAKGNSSTQTQDVTLFDFTDPIPDTAILADINAECEVLEADVTPPTATDNCSGTVTVTNDATFPITTQGTTTITWTFTDANGNSTTQTQDVTLFDFTEPTPDVAVLADINAQCEVLEADVTPPTATDNCSGTVTVTNDATFPITAQGTTTITWTYTDANGNFTTQTQDVTLFDFTEPTADVAILADINAQCEVLEADVTPPTATDNCSAAVTVTSDAVFPITAQGTTMITWTYTDANGNFSTQTQDVTLFDFTEPTPDAAVLADINADCAVLEADVTPPTATDNCSGVVTVTSDAVFPITTPGTTVITWTYADANGNSITQTQDVNIFDVTAPIPDAAVLADITAQCEVLEADVTAPTATDCSGAVTVTNDADFPIALQGTTVITWTFEDADGNTSTQTQNVVISDVTGPTANGALADIIAECEVLEADVTPPTVTDNCSGSVTVTTNTIFPITAQGTTTIVWRYADTNGNITLQFQNVVISDVTGPTPDAAALADITGECEVVEADVTAPTATDNCSAIVTVTNNAVFPITAQGTTVITWSYTDANSNTTTQTQNVVIEDTTTPVTTLTALSVSVDVAGTVTISPAQLENGTSTDNCGISTMTVIPDTFTCQELGDHTVTVTVTDIHGNATSETVTVTVTDPNNYCALGVANSGITSLVLYPNPTGDVLYIQPGNSEAITAVKVYSLTGQVVLQASYREALERYSLSLGHLPNGVYLLRLETANGSFLQRVVKQ
jgi:sulfur transfer complex TusBCD TusB component (DsrH family)